MYEFIDPFRYYRIDLKNVNYDINDDFNTQALTLTSGKCEIYILATNPNTGMVYRLQGFNGNDFLTFLRDFKEIYRKKHTIIYPTIRYLKNTNYPKLTLNVCIKG